MWEDYGLQFASGNPVSLFPIYENAINIATDNQLELEHAFNEYALWRYFTGSRNIQNNFFEESAGYCTSSTFSIEDTYSMWSSTGGAYFIELPQDGKDLIISSNFINDINCTHITINSSDDILLTEISLNSNENYIDINSIDEGSQALIFNSSYDGTTSSQINFTIIENQSNLLGDLNYDGEINVVDVVILVDFVLLFSIPNADELILADINANGSIDIVDIVLLINTILSRL